MAYTPGCMCDDCVTTRQWAINEGMTMPDKDAYLTGQVWPNYPVPVIPLEASLIIFQGKCIGLDLVHVHSVDNDWHIAACYDRDTPWYDQ